MTGVGHRVVVDMADLLGVCGARLAKCVCMYNSTRFRGASM